MEPVVWLAPGWAPADPAGAHLPAGTTRTQPSRYPECMAEPPAIHLARIPRQARDVLLRAIGAAEGLVPVIRPDGVRIGAVVSAEVAVILEEILAGERPSRLLERQTDPAMRVRLAAISKGLRGRAGET